MKKVLLFAIIGILGITLFASAATLTQRLSGYILLQVQANGEAWYVNPTDSMRYYMKDGAVAYQMMRDFGLGITDADLAKIPAVSSTSAMNASASICSINTTANRLKGKILIQVQQHGEAWYIYPKTCRSIYMKDGQAAYEIMRFLGLGITNNDLTLIPVNQNSGTTPTASTPTTAIKFEGRYIDVHLHITPIAMSLADIIKNMDAQGMDMAVIMKPPASIIDTPQSTSGIPDAAVQYPDRFIALYGGEAVTMLEKAATSGSYTKADEEKYTSLLETEMKSGQYKGFGEIGLRHFVPAGDKNPTAYDLTIPGDHPWMFIMSDIAAKYDVPIDIHMEATDETVKGLESLLDHNKNTKIIWDHASWSNTDQATPALISQLMTKHPNLYSSIKIRSENSTSAVYIYDNKGQITSEWLTLLKKYSDRFMIGSDIKPGRNADEFLIIKTHRNFLEQLPSEILKPIERDNAIKLFKIN
ncbi:MAG: amidohydrolase family protein [Candidatus Parcubacteria bacterium]|nr:amidohydrolase family protein [Candidatus Parcubacteria bacterium]